MTKSKIAQARAALIRQKERLDEDQSFRFASLFIPFMAAAVLTTYTSFETATHLYGVGQPLEHNSSTVQRSSLWLSIGSKQDQLIISAMNGETFRWNLSGPSKEQLATFSEFLNRSARQLVQGAVLGGQLRPEGSLVALSVDQSLTYHHIRPLIYALADAGFSKYGFETRIVR